MDDFIKGVSMETSGTMQDESALKIEVGDPPQMPELKRIDTVPEEKTVPVPIEQYANMIMNMQKLEDVRSIAQYATNNSLDYDAGLLSIAAILQGEDA